MGCRVSRIKNTDIGLNPAQEEIFLPNKRRRSVEKLPILKTTTPDEEIRAFEEETVSPTNSKHSLQLPTGSNKPSKTDIDSIDRAPPNKLNSGSFQDFSFKGTSMESSIDKEKDMTFLNNSMKNDNVAALKMQRSSTPTFKPSPFLLQKRNSEKSIFSSRINKISNDQNSTEDNKESEAKPSGSLQVLRRESGDETPKFHRNQNNKHLTFAMAANNVNNMSNILGNQYDSPERIEEEEPRIEKSSSSKAKNLTLQVQKSSKIEESGASNNESLNSEGDNLQGTQLEKKEESYKTLTSTKTFQTQTATSIDMITRELIQATNVTSPKGDKPIKTVEGKFNVNLLDLLRKKEFENQKEVENPKKPYVTTTSIENLPDEPQNKTSEFPKGSSKTTSQTTTMPDTASTEKTMRRNLLQLAREEELPQKLQNKLSLNFEIFGDMDGFSPIDHMSGPPLGMTIQLQGGPLTGRDSFMLDKTIYNVEDNISRMDLEKYSFYENVQTVEFNDKSVNNSLEKRVSPSDFDPKKTLLNVNLQPGSKRNLLAPHYFKSKTTNLDQGALVDTESSIVLSNKEKGSTGSLGSTTNVGSAGDLDSQGSNHLKPTTNQLNTSISQGLKTSPSIFKKYQRTKSEVVETKQLDKTTDEDGQKKINQYVLVKELGRGAFGKVKLGLNSETNEQFAIKVINKGKLKRKLLSKSKSAYTQVETEIAIMKKLDHPNIVKLIEVIDDPNDNKLYLIMELVKKGAVLSKSFWKHENITLGELDMSDGSVTETANKTLNEQKAKKYFRHLILGLDYMHNYANVIHRDIKPENLLISEKDVLKVSDFGISHIMEDEESDELKNDAGTKYFLAPEAWIATSYHGKPADIWAAGATLYYFVVGRPPFYVFSNQELKQKVLSEEVSFPPELNLNPGLMNLISQCLIKDPTQRIKIEEIKNDDWLTDNGTNSLENDSHEEEFQITDDEISKAITKLRFRGVIMLTAKFKKKLNDTRRILEKKRTEDPAGIMMNLDQNQ